MNSAGVLSLLGSISIRMFLLHLVRFSFLLFSRFAAVKRMAPSSLGKVQKFLMDSRIAAVKETAPSSPGMFKSSSWGFVVAVAVYGLTQVLVFQRRVVFWTGAGHFFLKLQDGRSRDLPHVSARDFLSFCEIVNAPDCIDGLLLTLFDRDGVSALDLFLHVLHLFSGFVLSCSIGANWSYFSFLEVALQCFRLLHFSVSRSVPAFLCWFGARASFTVYCSVSVDLDSSVLCRMFWNSLGRPIDYSFSSMVQICCLLWSSRWSRLSPREDGWCF